MSNSSPDLQEEINRLIESAARFSKRVEVLKANVPGCLFHFTTADGLAKILTSHSLLVSHVECLNDSSEIAYGIQLGHDVVSERSRNLDPAETEARFLRASLLALDEGEVQASVRFDTFAICFCPSDRDLVHWAHYGQWGDGYAIGLRVKDLIRPPFEVVKIEYDPGRQRRLLSDATDEILAALVQGLGRVSANESDALVGNAGHALSMLIGNLAAGMKRREFAPEQEWRLLAVDYGEEVKTSQNLPEKGSQPLTRVIGNRIVPGHLLRFDEGLPIVSIRYGSRVDPRAAVRGLQYLLKENGYDVGNIPISSADLPLR